MSLQPLHPDDHGPGRKASISREDLLAAALKLVGNAFLVCFTAGIRDTLALVLDEMSHAEAGTILGVSEGTVSWRVSEAKKRLRALRAEEAR